MEGRRRSAGNSRSSPGTAAWYAAEGRSARGRAGTRFALRSNRPASVSASARSDCSSVSRRWRSRSCATARGCARRSPRSAQVGHRLHAFLAHEGWSCSRSRLLTVEGLRWAASLRRSEHGRRQLESLLAVMAALKEQLDDVDAELRRLARAAMLAAGRCSRSTVSGRSSPATCSPRSGRRCASAAPSRSRVWPGSTRSSRSRAGHAATASSPRPARRTCAGRSPRPRCTRTLEKQTDLLQGPRSGENLILYLVTGGCACARGLCGSPFRETVRRPLLAVADACAHRRRASRRGAPRVCAA
jgi:hypothetical protein